MNELIQIVKKCPHLSRRRPVRVVSSVSVECCAREDVRGLRRSRVDFFTPSVLTVLSIEWSLLCKSGYNKLIHYSVFVCVILWSDRASSAR